MNYPKNPEATRWFCVKCKRLTFVQTNKPGKVEGGPCKADKTYGEHAWTPVKV